MSYAPTALELAALRERNSHHRAQLELHGGVCFHCGEQCTTAEDAPDRRMVVREWVDRGTTALCPHCGIDAVIPLDGNALNFGYIAALHCQNFHAAGGFNESGLCVAWGEHEATIDRLAAHLSVPPEDDELVTGSPD